MQRVFIKRFGAIALAAALLAAFAWVALTQGPMAPPRVVLSEVREGELAPQAFGIGTVEARLSHAIGAVQAGRLLRVTVDQGDAVKRGEVLAEIDPVDLDERLAAARSAHERARHSADAAAAQVSEAKARQQMAEASASRYRDLARQGFVSGDAVDARTPRPRPRVPVRPPLPRHLRRPGRKSSAPVPRSRRSPSNAPICASSVRSTASSPRAKPRQATRLSRARQ